MNAVMHAPDVRFAKDTYTLADMRRLMELAAEFINEFAVYDSVGEGLDYRTGKDLSDDLNTAASQLYLYERSLKK